MKNLAEQVAKKLLDNNLTIAVAESCTGGLICYKLTSISGSSNYFKCGYVVYSNEAKIKNLSIPEETIQKHGAVSKEVAMLMAKMVKEKSSTDIGIGVTGIAGPTGGTPQKPVGLVYIGLATFKKNICKEYNFKGTREKIRIKSSQKALEMILKLVN